MKHRLLWGSGFCAAIFALVFTLTSTPDEQIDVPARPELNRSAFSSKADNVLDRAAYEALRLRDPHSGEVPKDMRTRELDFARNLPSTYGSAAKRSTLVGWTYRGPDNVGGRTRALAIDRNYDGASNQRILAGGVSGGMFKSEDGGASWQLTTNLDQLASVTAIAQDPNNPAIWYYGTGEFRGNSASSSGAPFLGHGLFKSTDSGNTWTQMASTISGEGTSLDANDGNDLNQRDDLFDFVWNIKIHPNGTIYVAGWAAILVSEDNGASWEVSLESFGNYADVTISADGTVYAALSRDGTAMSANNEYGIYRRTNTGWEDISPPDMVANPFRIVLDAAASDADQLYALVQSGPAGAQTEDHQLFRYNASSDSWTTLTSSLPEETAPGPNGELPVDGGPAEFVSQAGYDMVVKVSPTNPDHVWIGGTNLYRSVDAGGSFTRVGGYASAYTAAIYDTHHPDQHVISFFPHVANAMISGHDGGLSMTMNVLESPQTWTSLNNGYRTSQFYSIAIDPEPTPNSEHSILGGLQDNGSWLTSDNNAGSAWEDIFSGDGSFAAIVPGAETVYASAQQGAVFRFRPQPGNDPFANVAPAGASNFLFLTPFMLDPNDPTVMYLAAGDMVWRNSNLDAIEDFSSEPTTVNWSALNNGSGTAGTVTALGVPKQGFTANVMYYGATHFDRGTTDLLRIANPAGNGTSTSIKPPGVIDGSWTSSITINELNEQEILVTYSNYGIPSVFHTMDGGISWSSIEGNLGGDDGPSVRWSAIMPTTSGSLYILATSTGVYSTETLNGANTVWEMEGPDTIGNVVVNMLATRLSDGLVVAATHGRGVYSANVVGPPLSNDDDIEVPQRVRLEQNYPNPFNPETTIRYELEASQEIELSVFDATGRRIRVLERGVKAPGMHEVQWNGTDQAGQTMASGTYFYRLQVLGGQEVLTGEMVLLK